RHEIRRSGERVRRVGRVGRLRISLILLLAAAAETLVFRARITRSNPELIVGVLEDIPPHYAGQSNSREVRVLFRKSNDASTAFPSKMAGLWALWTPTPRRSSLRMPTSDYKRCRLR